jgi:uncharacterized protein YraI
MRKFLLFSAAAIAIAAAGYAHADTLATTIAPANVRAGPSSQDDVIATLGSGETVDVIGCVQRGRWCRIAFDGGEGFISSRRLSGDLGGTVILTDRSVGTRLRVVESPPAREFIIDPPVRVRTYVTTNRLPPLRLTESDVVVGGTLPGTVELREVPDYRYRYAYLNERPVLVEPGSRRIVYIYD